MTPKQREALAWLAKHGPVYSWEVRRRSGFQARTFEALAEKGKVQVERTISRYTSLPVSIYRHPNPEVPS